MKCEKITFPKPSDQLTEIATDLTCYLKENTSITHPSLVLYIKNGTDGAALYGANYCYIPKLGRYYFIDDIIIESDTIIRYNCTVDVLNSFSDSILNQTVLTSRMGSDATYQESYLFPDDRLPYGSQVSLTTFLKLGKLFESYSDEPENGIVYGWACITYFYVSSDSTETTKDFVSPYDAITHTVIIKYAKKYNNNLLDQILQLIVEKSASVASYICSIYLLPFTPTVNDYLGKELGIIKIGAYEVSSLLNDNVENVYETFYTIRHFVGKVYGATSTYNNIDYAPPHITYTVFLPLYGEIPISSEKAYTYQLYITYSIDFTVGSLTYKFLWSKVTGTNASGQPVWDLVSIETFNTSILNPIPITVTNAEQIDKTKIAYAANYEAANINSIASIVGGVISSSGTGNVASALGSVTTGVGSLSANKVSYKGQLNALLVSGTIAQSSSIWSSYDLENNNFCEIPYIQMNVYRTATPISRGLVYKKLQGSPVHLLNTISTLIKTYGAFYLEISECHLDNIYSTTDNSMYATSEELDMIYEALTSGVILSST